MGRDKPSVEAVRGTEVDIQEVDIVEVGIEAVDTVVDRVVADSR